MRFDFIQPAPPEQGRGGRTSSTGRVTLIGAGPGAAEFLTLQALRALSSADVVLYDSLVCEEVLDLVPTRARRMSVGKRADQPGARQADINVLLTRLAGGGLHVVRLKSGDPMVFGRAGEEIAALREVGIPVSVVPGISAAQALAAALGVSLTHRDLAQSVRYVTGHTKDGDLPAGLDWRTLADRSTTTVIYMGARLADRLVDRLRSVGMDGSTPVAVGVALGRADEAVGVTTLAQLASMVIRPELAGQPIVIGLGRVFAECGRPFESDTDASTAASREVCAV